MLQSLPAGNPTIKQIVKALADSVVVAEADLAGVAVLAVAVVIGVVGALGIEVVAGLEIGVVAFEAVAGEVSAQVQVSTLVPLQVKIRR